ncbi:hypothetical protein LZC95_32545 [Pendulispora brunnea]|uniref:DUF6875 domain-containing protein n=2 Tax=Pendulispora brunnea TaxID=2905690 RepID=A0ABZ2JXF4_9BACT
MDLAGMMGGMRAYRRWFEHLGPDMGQRALMVIFPDIHGHDVHGLVDSVQRRLKSEFVDRGLMIGEFHSGPPAAPGLHNADFRPLRSPLPMLAIRAMVPSDLPFLRGDTRHCAAYRARFGKEPR